ncbi:MAG: hypothetical protein JXR73_04670 [Candidatus Omnitrophica bacterium]|nr:hypothetical protein [Candidatus Omnitrophota bacterium]
MEDHSRSVNLFAERGETSRFVSAEITEDEDLVVSGHDIGKDPQTFFGDGDYEFWLVVHKEEKDLVLLALLEALYGGHFSAVDELRDYLNAKNIQYDWQVWS